jgi:hypothetical protein
MGKEQWDAFKRNVILPDEHSENEQRQRAMRDFVRTLEKECGIELTKKIFAAVCHGLKPSDLPWAREHFVLYNDIDKFCEVIAKENTAIFTNAYETGQWVHGQEIDKEVLDFLTQFPELLYGKREGNSIVAIAIPFNTRAYLSEQDPVKKRFHACHCHFARDTILMDGGAVSKTLCYCSLGHTRVFWESALDTPLEGEVIESALGGDMMCKFRIYLPDEIMKRYVKEECQT